MLVKTSEVANRVLIASRLPLAPMNIKLPTFDQQFPPNLLGVRIPSLGLSVLGIRVPAYKTACLRLSAWNSDRGFGCLHRKRASNYRGRPKYSDDGRSFPRWRSLPTHSCPRMAPR